MVTAVTVTVRQTHKLILCKLYTFYAKVIYFWSITHILIKTSHCARYGVFGVLCGGTMGEARGASSRLLPRYLKAFQAIWG